MMTTSIQSIRRVIMDPRFKKLAKLLVGYSTQVGKGDRVLLQTSTTTPHQMHVALVEEVRRAGGVMMAPQLMDERLSALCQAGCTKKQLAADAAAYMIKMLAADVRIAFRGFDNIMEMSHVPPEDSKRHNQIITGLCMEEAIENTRWVLTRWPTPAFAQLAGMSTADFEDFFFNAVLVDYKAMTASVQPLIKLMQRTDKVQILGPDTELSFSIKGIPAVPCTGLRNIPDGEVYTAPVRDSMNGHIHYNTVTITKSGQRFGGVRFEIKDGKIINAACDDGDVNLINEILDTDESARYFGEFALGINWGVTKTVGDTLFDEKVGGSLHLTPGMCYDDAPNGNKSAVHWDIILDQRAEHGGGEIYFDGKPVRKDGLFLPKKLHGLNPPNN